MDGLPGLFSQTPVSVDVEAERFAIFETSEPPLHSDTLRAGPNQSTQFTDTFLNYICGLRAAGKPERSVVAAHSFDPFAADGTHCAYQPAKNRPWQCICEQMNFAQILLTSSPGLGVGSGSLIEHRCPTVAIVGRLVVNVIESWHEMELFAAELGLEDAKMLPRMVRFVCRRNSPQVVPFVAQRLGF